MTQGDWPCSQLNLFASYDAQGITAIFSCITRSPQGLLSITTNFSFPYITHLLVFHFLYKDVTE